MKRQHLYYICIGLAAVGVATVYASSMYIEPESFDINQLQRSWQGRKVVLTGNVSDPYKAGGHSFFELDDGTGRINAVAFNSELELEEGQSVSVEGRLSMYEGQLEVIVDELERR